MAKKSGDRTDEVLEGLQQLVDAGRVAEVEEMLTTIVETEPEKEPTAKERETRSYAEGMRDGISLARGLSS
ncbi:hypothetical protein [Actinomycetospora atypica]|uniref:Uncharacterized protein n=1 Tax=Actinomycetospora atypica TaxID=1290095 RepID=A0ABV9YKF9_9PSEU